jgi:dihydrofolate reductase
MPRKLILYIACSLDGYIAGPGDNLDFLGSVHVEGEDYGYADFVKSIDTVILGRRTYEWVIAQTDFPHTDKETYVISRNARKGKDKLQFYPGDLKKLLNELKSRPGKGIFCDGGATLVNALLREKCFDELIISYVPVLLGEGIRLFNDSRPAQELKLLSSRAYPSGLLQVHYQVVQPG